MQFYVYLIQSIHGEVMTKERILYVVFFVLAITKINSQEVKFGWSLGDISWSYNFLGKDDITDYNLLKFSVSFEKINVMINTSIMSGVSKNNRNETDPFYNLFLPLEVIYTPFKWKYVHISAYGRGAWEIGYNGDIDNPNEISNGFFGSIGLRIGLFPIESNFFKYKSHIVNIFSEYTLRNELKLGLSLDILDLVYFGFQIWRKEQEEKIKNKNVSSTFSSRLTAVKNKE
jgi:hypothetical protein